MSTRSERRSLLSLLPFLIFLSLYIVIGFWLTLKGEEYAFYRFPAASCALIGFGAALIFSMRRSGEQIKTFALGIGDENVILMCLIFMLAGAFSAVTQAMGGVDATVNMGLFLLPDRFLLPGIFMIACFVSLAMGTSMGTIGTVVPIAVGVAAKAGLDLPITIGAVVGGAMFGDNLSIISDTTVAAATSLGCDMRSKSVANFKIALPAALFVTILLFFFSEPTWIAQPFEFSVLKTFPYILVLILALVGFNVINVLMIGIAVAALIGMASGSLDFLQFGKAIYDGFMSMADIFFLTFLTAGLAAIATKDGGLKYLLKKLHWFIRSKRSAEAGIGILVSVADLCIANNTIAIIVTGKMAKEIADKFQLPLARAASLIDIFSCVWQGLIPYGARLLLAGSLAKLSPFQILPYVWYAMALAIAAIIAIALQRPKNHVTQRA